MPKTYDFTEVEYRIIRHCLEFTLQNRDMTDREKEYIQTVKDKIKNIHDTKTE